eukprot:12396-Heterococcus_DN1.PRE.2
MAAQTLTAAAKPLIDASRVVSSVETIAILLFEHAACVCHRAATATLLTPMKACTGASATPSSNAALICRCRSTMSSCVEKRAHRRATVGTRVLVGEQDPASIASTCRGERAADVTVCSEVLTTPASKASSRRSA